MSNRKKTSGGQAIVMVSLALISMSGMMGLAVDLGWSFFTQKAAQAAADDAALSAVQRAYKTIVSEEIYVPVFSFCSDTSDVVCEATPVSCNPGNLGLGNLQSGCLYAKNDGFVPGGHGGRQNVLIQANVASVALPNSIPTPPGPPRDMVYWVTVRTYENIPQLFSFVNGKQNGGIAAVATAAIASKVMPGSFWGMNQRGDCMFKGGQPGSFTYTNCGVDINVSGNGSGASCGAGLPSAYLCAPSGIVLSSTCANNALAGCGNNTGNPGSTSGPNYAGNQGVVYGGPAIEIAAANAADGLTATPTPTVAGNPSDPYANRPQPPLVAPSSPISSCGYPNGAIPNTTNHLGPFQYYSYTTTTVNGAAIKVPNAMPIQLPSGGAIFDPAITDASGCPGGVFTAGTAQSSSFPAYIFYGGLNVTGTGSNPTVTMGAGQYVMAGNLSGANTVSGGSGGSDNVIAAKNVTFTGSGTSSSATDPGTMLILTDAKYPGLSNQMSGIPNWNCTTTTCGGVVSKIDPAQTTSNGENWLVQGSISTKNANWTLDGYNKNNTSQSIKSLEQYSGVLVWQDRRNSTDILDPATGAVLDCYVNCGTNTPTTAQYTANNVTATSPGLSMSDGNGTMVLKGAIYQPRGAWYQLYPGGTGVGNSPLQILTGMLTCGSGSGGGGCGSTAVTLLGPTNPIITYLPVLIQ